MGTFAKDGSPLQNKWRAVAASQTTAQISVSGDGVPTRDYLERVYVQYTSTASPGTVTVYDGAQALFVCSAAPALIGNLVQVFEVGVTAQTTKGFNVTTGSSVACICIGVF
jgi:hypothetical protein